MDVETEIENYYEIIKKIEDEELETGILSSEVYRQLLAAYLYINDYSNALFLWQRIPANIKQECKEIDRLHTMLIAMKNNRPDYFNYFEFDWSENIKKIMEQMKEKCHKEALELVANAYTSIYENKLSELTNLSPEKLKEAYKRLGWKCEEHNQQRLILPAKAPAPKTTVPASEDQLFLLTEFVSFLEN